MSPLSGSSLAPSDAPPGDLAATQVPQFVMIGFDDNPDVDPMRWILDHAADLTNPAGAGQAATYDGAAVRFAFYSNGTYLEETPELAALHAQAHAAGHEIGNHTHNHRHGGAFTVAEWREEIARCREALIAAGVPAEAMIGFRTPFLEYNAATFEAVEAEGFVYDTSIEEGGQPDQDGTNFLWPYTLDAGSPGNAEVAAVAERKERVGRHPGLWEIPLHVFMVPDDALCAAYGVEPGLRRRMQDYVEEHYGWSWDSAAGKLTGLDWNAFDMAGLDGPEFLAVLKHTLDRRLAGNRAPLMVGGHTQLYPADKPDRREALEAFIAHALSHPEVRFVTPRQLLDWLQNPVPLAE